MIRLQSALLAGCGRSGSGRWLCCCVCWLYLFTAQSRKQRAAFYEKSFTFNKLKQKVANMDVNAADQKDY